MNKTDKVNEKTELEWLENWMLEEGEKDLPERKLETIELVLEFLRDRGLLIVSGIELEHEFCKKYLKEEEVIQVKEEEENISDGEMTELIDNIRDAFRKGGYDISRDKIGNFVEVMCFVLDYIKERENRNE